MKTGKIVAPFFDFSGWRRLTGFCRRRRLIGFKYFPEASYIARRVV
jgi:hypothetical protein